VIRKRVHISRRRTKKRTIQLLKGPEGKDREDEGGEAISMAGPKKPTAGFVEERSGKEAIYQRIFRGSLSSIAGSGEKGLNMQGVPEGVYLSKRKNDRWTKYGRTGSGKRNEIAQGMVGAAPG